MKQLGFRIYNSGPWDACLVINFTADWKLLTNKHPRQSAFDPWKSAFRLLTQPLICANDTLIYTDLKLLTNKHPRESAFDP